MPKDLPQLKEYAEKLKLQLESQKRRLEKIEARRKHFDNFMYISTRIWIIITILVLIFNYSSNIFINNKITVMTNNIEISPYVSDIEYKKFKSDFHTIQCYRDYEDLEQTLQSIADAHAIALKK